MVEIFSPTWWTGVFPWNLINYLFGVFVGYSIAKNWRNLAWILPKKKYRKQELKTLDSDLVMQFADMMHIKAHQVKARMKPYVTITEIDEKTKIKVDLPE